MTKIKIITDRLPQANRRKGAILDVTPEKADSLIAQGFAVFVAEGIAPEPVAEGIVPEPVAAPRRQNRVRSA